MIELNNKDSSMFFYRMYRSVSDSLFSENNQRNAIVNESEWTIKKKELENNTLKELTAVQKRQIAFKNILLFLIGNRIPAGCLCCLSVVQILSGEKIKGCIPVQTKDCRNGNAGVTGADESAFLFQQPEQY